MSLFKWFSVICVLFSSVYSDTAFTVGSFCGLSHYKYSVNKIDAWDSDVPYKNGFTFGISSERIITKLFSVGTGVNYSTRGGKKYFTQSLPQDSIRPLSEEDKYCYNYLSIPVHTILNYPIKSHFTLYGIGGLNFAFLLSNTLKYETTWHQGNWGFNGNRTGEETLSHLNFFDLGYDVGGGFSVPLNNWIPFFEILYYGGIINIAKQTYHFDNAEYGMIKNQGFELRFGLKYKVQKR